MKKYFLDANVYLRFILKDELKLAGKAQKYFLDAKTGKIELVLAPEILIEINYVLQKVYLVSREEIVRHLSALAKASYIKVVDRPLLIETIRFYQETAVDFVDCLLFTRAKSQEGEVLSFDKDFKKLEKAEGAN